jgi:hypothetical protein
VDELLTDRDLWWHWRPGSVLRLGAGWRVLTVLAESDKMSGSHGR